MDFNVGDHVHEPPSRALDAQMIHDLLNFSAQPPSDLRLISHDIERRLAGPSSASSPLHHFPHRPSLATHSRQPMIDPRARRGSQGAPPTHPSVAFRPRPSSRLPSSFDALFSQQLRQDPAMTHGATREQQRALRTIQQIQQMEHAHAHTHSRTEDTSSSAASKTCVVCMDTIDEKVIFTPCNHSFDVGCIEGLISAALKDESMFPPSCCARPIPIELVERDIDPSVVSLYKEKSAEYGTVLRVYCSKKTCSRFLGARNSRDAQSPARALPCSGGCGQFTCNTCLNEVAGGDIAAHVCSEDESEQQIHQLADSKHWARCPGCRTVVELSTGCNHVVCRCGTQFCYICSSKWGSCRCALVPRRHSQAAQQRRAIIRRRSHPYQRPDSEEVSLLDSRLNVDHTHVPNSITVPPQPIAVFPPGRLDHQAQLEAAYNAHLLEQRLDFFQQHDRMSRQQRTGPSFIPITTPGSSGPTGVPFYSPFERHHVEQTPFPPHGSEWQGHRGLPDSVTFTQRHQPVPPHEPVAYNPSLDLSELMGLSDFSTRHQDDALVPLELLSNPFATESTPFMW